MHRWPLLWLLDVAIAKLQGFDSSGDPAFPGFECAGFSSRRDPILSVDSTADALCKSLIRETPQDVADVARTKLGDVSLLDTSQVYTSELLVGKVEGFLKENRLDGGPFDVVSVYQITFIKALLDKNVNVYIRGSFVRDALRGINGKRLDISIDRPWKDVKKFIPSHISKQLTSTKTTFKLGSQYEIVGTCLNPEEAPLPNANAEMSMDALSLSLGCLREPRTETCYLLDFIGFAVKHAIPGVMGLYVPGKKPPIPKDDESLDHFTFWLAENCERKYQQCWGLLRFMLFQAEGFTPTKKFFKFAMPTLRRFLAAADKYDKPNGGTISITDTTQIKARRLLRDFFHEAGGHRTIAQRLHSGCAMARALLKRWDTPNEWDVDDCQDCVTREKLPAMLVAWAQVDSVKFRRPCGGFDSPSRRGWFLFEGGDWKKAEVGAFNRHLVSDTHQCKLEKGSPLDEDFDVRTFRFQNPQKKVQLCYVPESVSEVLDYRTVVRALEDCGAIWEWGRKA